MIPPKQFHTHVIAPVLRVMAERDPRFLLAENELARIFSGFDIIRNQITWLDDGRPMSAFIARNPA